MPSQSSWLRREWVLLVALVLLAAHVLLYRAWLIDDAGITFAYARNLAAGHGLVAQAGTAPVEGYSNPLWTLLVALCYWFGAFAEPTTPKLIAFGLTAATLTLIQRDLRNRVSSTTLSWTVLMLAACTPFVIWTNSGLENGLLAFLVVLACRNTLATVADRRGAAGDVSAGVLAGLLGLTRPDAILYCATHAIAVAATEWTSGGAYGVRSVKRWLFMAAGLVPTYASYLAFRIYYFGDVVPNTYHAKQKPTVAGLFQPGKLFDLLESATADFALPVAAFVAFAVVALVIRRRLTLRLVVLLANLGVSSVIYLVMPPDWMGEFRFATAFFALLYWTLAELASTSAVAFSVAPALQRAFKAVALICAVQAGIVFAARALTFTANPPVPLASIKQFGADGFNQLAALVGADRASVLTSDLGGMLLDSKLRVVDLAGLCDRTVARAISINGDPARLHSYVFEETRPTFMHVVGTFVRLSRFDGDPRFSRDYVPIYESWIAPPEWPAIWKSAVRVPPFIGDYVRRDAIAYDPTLIGRLRDVHRRLAMERSVGDWQQRREGFGVKRPLTVHAAATVYRELLTRRDDTHRGVAADTPTR